jgi:hypothetical protein
MTVTREELLNMIKVAIEQLANDESVPTEADHSPATRHTGLRRIGRRIH